jgi:hypothetical protein
MKRKFAALAITLGATAGLATAFSLSANASTGNFSTVVNGTSHYYPCDEGHNYDNPAVPMSGAANGCNYRVWLHQYTNYVGHGWGLCVSPHSYADFYPPGKYNSPKNIQITSNPDNC